MDSINVDKIQALKKYKQQQFINSLMFYPFLAFICTVFCTSPFWFPSLYTSTKTFFFVSIPQILCFFFNVKSLFILGNLIIVFLLKESKIKSQDHSKPQKFDVVDAIKENGKQMSLPLFVEDEVEEESIEELCEEEEKVGNMEDEDEDEFFEDLGENDEMEGLMYDDLNKRAENFIAMVNKQIRLEANHDQVLLCCC